MFSFNNFLKNKDKKNTNLIFEQLEKGDDIDTSEYLKHSGKQYDPLNYKHYDEIHEHPDIKPQILSREHLNVISDHTSSSKGYNDYLERRYKGTTTNDDEFDNHINNLSSAFTKENTNRKPIVSYSGIPERVGKKLLNSQKGSKHTLPRFTSTSTDRTESLFFADRRSRSSKSGDLHLLKLYNEPGAALSVVKHSEVPTENELLLNHGAHVTYHHTTKENINFKSEDSGKTSPAKRTLYTHHVIVHNTHTPLEHYGKYT